MTVTQTRRSSRLVAGVFFVLLLALLIGALSPANTSAHAVLLESDPPAGSIQPVAPEIVTIWFTEPLVPEMTSIQVFAEDRTRVDADNLIIDATDDTRAEIALNDLIDGTYTVSWHSASVYDNHPVQGSFTFRVGHSRVPGAAAVEGDRPSPMSVSLRWLTLGGLATVAGWFLFGVLGDRSLARRFWLPVAGVGLALVADLALIPLQTTWLGTSASVSVLAYAAAALPWSWALRVVSYVLLGLVLLLMRRQERSEFAWAGVAGAVIGTVSLTFTSHAASDANLRPLAMVSNALHLLATVFWVGGLIQLVTLLVLGERQPAVAGRFSRIAFVLAPLAVATGVANAGLTLPSPESLWQSAYGQVLLGKSLVVILILSLAWFNRRWLASGLRAAVQLSRTIGAESALAVLAVLLASTLALSVPPSSAAQEPLHLRVLAGENQYAHLEISPPTTAKPDVFIWLTDSDDVPVSGVNRAYLTISMLERPVDLNTMSLSQTPDGRWRQADIPVSIKGWWRASVRFDGHNMEASGAEFLLFLPDPTLASAERDRDSDPAGLELFKSAISRLTELRSMTAHEELSDGIGNSVVTDYSYVAPDRMSYETGTGNRAIGIGNTQFMQETDGRWTERERGTPVAFPEMLPAQYSGATQFALGRQEMVDGELTQVLTFHVPEIPGRGESWYAWWVGTESGLIRQEGMVAYYHYMTSHYADHDSDLKIVAPEAASGT